MSNTEQAHKPNKNSLPGLYYLRIALGLQQNDLAELSGVSVGHISRIETGVVDCRTDICLKLAEALGVTPNDLLFKPSERRILELKISRLRRQLEEEETNLSYLDFKEANKAREEEAT